MERADKRIEGTGKLELMQMPSSRGCSSCCLNPLLSNQNRRPEPPDSTGKSNIDPRQEFFSSIVSSIQQKSQFFTNHESLPSLEESVSSLNKTCPQHLKTSLADQIRSQEYYHLSQSNHVYLDYIGNGLFSYSQQEFHHSRTSIPSSSSSSIQVSSANLQVPFFGISYKSLTFDSQESEFDFESSMRRRILKYMNLSEDDYSIVFAANQESAFKILAELYPFETNQNLITVYDHKNEGIEGMIESSKKKGAQTISAEFSWPSLRINSRKLKKMILNRGNKKNRGLFVFPLQSRITGSRYSYLWMNLAQENGWHILLDADSLGSKPMDTVGLCLFSPDFLISSFFKVFGENPSGFTCLFVKKSRIQILKKPSKSIGIVSLVPSSNSRISRQPSSNEHSSIGFGTAAELVPRISSRKSSIIIDENSKNPQLKSLGEMIREESLEATNLDLECKGLDHADEIGLIMINIRTKYLVNWLINALICLRHPHSESGIPLIRIYGPKIRFNRGFSVAFNVFDWKGDKIEPALVQKLADRNNISLTCGFLKNIWFSDSDNELKEEMLEENKKKIGIGNGKWEIGISVVTVSIGFLNNFEDLYRLWAFVSRFLDADFVEKERWRYMALNQTTVEV